MKHLKRLGFGLIYVVGGVSALFGSVYLMVNYTPYMIGLAIVGMAYLVGLIREES